MAYPSNRYQRQHQVTQLGGQARSKLAKAHVLIVGAGGLGSPVSLYLAGAGVGEISLIDSDIVSLSNLHRQILYQENDISTSKVDAACNRLRSLNSEITVNSINAQLSTNNVAQLVSGVDVVVDAADNFITTYLLSDVCSETKIPLVSASVLGTHGYLGVFCGSLLSPDSQVDLTEGDNKQCVAPSYRAVFPSPPAQADNCNSAGVTGPSVGIIGSYQAQEVLKVIVGDPSQLIGRLMYLDLWSYQQKIIDFNGAPEPSNKAEIVDIATLDDNDVLLDVRNESEVQRNPTSRSHSAGNVINLPLAQLRDQAKELLLADTRIVCVCKSGQRALSAAYWLINNGYKNVAVSIQSI